MKTYFKEFSINDGTLSGDVSSELEEVICNRIEKFRKTIEYYKANEEVTTTLKKIEGLLPGEQNALRQLEDFIFYMEGVCFSAAYKDGMADLMTAMSFNKLGLTKVEYVDLSRKGFM
ncbi:MAG: hypothetical protein NHB14_01445 [Desulfosporosinus sp.]|nr:hypothetical protein [Desulfosporosinus sp.]